MTSLLEMMQAVVDEGAYGSISGGIISNNNELAKRLEAISNRVIQEMSETYPWRELWKTGTITLADGVSSYALPADFNYHHIETFWNSDQTIPLTIISPDELGYLNGYGIETYPVSNFYIRGVSNTTLSIRPTPGANDDAQTVGFEYASDRCVKPRTWESGIVVTSIGTYIFYNGNYYTSTNTGTTGATPPTHTSGSASDGTVDWQYYAGSYSKFLADTDEIVLNERIFMQGVLERLSITNRQNIQPRFQSEMLAAYSRQAPARTISACGSSGAFTYARNGKVIFSTGI